MLLDGDKKSSGNQNKYDGFAWSQTLDGIQLELAIIAGSCSKLLKQISHKLHIVRSGRKIVTGMG